MIVLIGIVIGLILGLVTQPDIPPALQPYLPIAVIAALDSMVGALRAHFDGVFSDRIFITSFIFNVLVAALIVFVGDQIGVGSQMTTAVVVVLGIRIFANVAALRRHLFKA